MALPPEVLDILRQQGLLGEEDQGGGLDVTEELRQLGILPPAPEPESTFSKLTQPVRTLFGATRSLGGYAAGLIAPEAYQRAAEELQTAQGITEESPWYKRVEALPSAGSVLGATIPEEAKRSLAGRALLPITELGVDILTDPTTYLGGLLSKGAISVARGIPEANAALEGAVAAERAAQTVDDALKARQFGAQAVAAAVEQFGSPTQNLIFKQGSALAHAGPLALGAGAGIAYGPSAVQGAIAGWQRVANEPEGTTASETAADAVDAALQSGLAALMGKGLIDAARANTIWRRHITEKQGGSLAETEAAMQQIGEEALIRAPVETGVPPQERVFNLGPGEPGPEIPKPPAPGEIPPAALGEVPTIPVPEGLERPPLALDTQLPTPELAPEGAPPALIGRIGQRKLRPTPEVPLPEGLEPAPPRPPVEAPVEVRPAEPLPPPAAPEPQPVAPEPPPPAPAAPEAAPAPEPVPPTEAKLLTKTELEGYRKDLASLSDTEIEAEVETWKDRIERFEGDAANRAGQKLKVAQEELAARKEAAFTKPAEPAPVAKPEPAVPPAKVSEPTPSALETAPAEAPAKPAAPVVEADLEAERAAREARLAEKQAAREARGGKKAEPKVEEPAPEPKVEETPEQTVNRVFDLSADEIAGSEPLRSMAQSWARRGDARVGDLLTRLGDPTERGKVLRQLRDNLGAAPAKWNAKEARGVFARQFTKGVEYGGGRELAPERRAAGAEGPVGGIAREKGRVGAGGGKHFFALRDAVESPNSPAQKAGIKDVVEYVKQLPEFEYTLGKAKLTFKAGDPYTEGFKKYIEVMKATGDHGAAIKAAHEAVVAAGRQVATPAVQNAMNAIGARVRELEAEGLGGGKEFGPQEKRVPTTEEVDRLAGMRDTAVANIRAALKSGDRDALSAALGEYAGFSKAKGLYRMPPAQRIGAYAGDAELKKIAQGLGIDPKQHRSTEKLLRAIAADRAVPIAAVKEAAKEVLAPQAEAIRKEKLAAAKGAAGPGGFALEPRRGNEQRQFWKGPDGLRVSKAADTVLIEKIPADAEGLARDVQRLAQDPEVKNVDFPKELKGADARAVSNAIDETGAFILDPDESRELPRFVRKDPVQRRTDMMEARTDPETEVSPSWADPRFKSDPRQRPITFEAAADDAIRSRHNPDMLALKRTLEAKGYPGLDLGNPSSESASGWYHTVFFLNGAKDAKGNGLVMRVGRAPHLPLTPEQEALFQPTVAKGTLIKNFDGEPLYYTIHPEGVGGREAMFVGSDDALRPPGVSPKDMEADVGLLLDKAVAAQLTTRDVFIDKEPRGNQFLYVPVDAIDTRGVGRIDTNGKAWQLVLSDRGAMYPSKASPVEASYAPIHEANRVALQEVGTKATSELTEDQRLRQLQHYDEDGANALPVELGDGLTAVNHDRLASDDFVAKSADLGAGYAVGMQEVAKDLVDTVNRDLGGEPINVVYKGLTTSPHLAGLYHQPLGGGAAHIYTNVAEAAAAGKSYEGAIDAGLHTLIHETIHDRVPGHDATFVSYEEYVKRLLTAQGKMEEYRARLKKAFSEEDYNAVRDELVPDYLEQRRTYGRERRSWSGEAVEGVPSRAAEGGAPAVAYRRAGGAEAAAGNRNGRLQPGGAVQRGGGGPAGGVRPAAAARAGAAEGPAAGEPAGPSARGGVGAEEHAQWVRRIGEKVPEGGVSTIEEAKAVLNRMMELRGGPKQVRLSDHMRDSMQISKAMVEKLKAAGNTAEIARLAESLPYPTKPGQVEGPLNMLHLVDLPNEFKARMKILYDLTKDTGEWARDTPETWASVDKDVTDMLGLHTPEEFEWAFRNKKGGLTSKEVLLLREVGEALNEKVVHAELRLDSALHDPNVSPELVADLQKQVWDAERGAIQGSLTVSNHLTGVARALAIARKDIRARDPRLAFEQDLLSALRERLRSKFKDNKKLAEEHAQGLLDQFLEIQRTNGDWGEFAKAYRALLGSKLWPDKVLEFYKAGLLGWPSRVANMSSNALLQGVRQVEQAVAAGLDYAATNLGRKKDRELYLGETTVAGLAMRRAWSQAIPQWAQEMKRNFLLQPDNWETMLGKGGIMEDLLQSGGAIGGRKGEFVRFHLKGLGADDALAKHFIRMDSLYRQVYRKLRKGEGEFWKPNTGESLAQATERIVGDLQDNWQRMLRGEQYETRGIHHMQPLMTEAEAAARRDTFQQELGNTGKGFQTFMRDNPWVQIFIPFFRTPVNITKETIARTPLGLIKVFREWNKLTDAQKISELSRPLTGTAIGAAFLAYAMTGEASGGGPLDPDERSMLESTGWQPYSMKLGDQYISYQRLEPIASILGVAADAAEGIKQGDFQKFQSGAMRVMQSAAENVTNKTFLSGVDAITSAISHPQQFLGTFIKRMQSSVIPNSLGFVPVSGLARAIDPIYRQSDPMTMSAFYYKLPFLSSTLEPQYAPSGEERRRPGTALEQIISPFARVKLAPGGTPARVGAEEVVRLGAAPRAPRRYWVAPGGTRVDMLPEERKALALAMQEATKLIGERIIKDPSYQRLPDNELDPNYRFGQKTKEDVIKKVYSRYRSGVLDRYKRALLQRARQQIEAR